MRICIVTVCYNASQSIEKTIKSVYEQDTSDYEYLVLDGKSTDSTLKILANWEKRFIEAGKNISIFSERDNGIYDAMNKAAKITSSDYILFMNSGDELFDLQTVRYINSIITTGNSFDAIYGDTQLYRAGLYMPCLSQRIDTIRAGLPFCHQSVLMKRSTMLESAFDTNYKICADYDWFLRHYLNGSAFKQVRRPISTYELMGYSSKNNGMDYYTECLKVKKANGIINDEQYIEAVNRFKRNDAVFKNMLKRLLPENVRNAVIREKLQAQGWGRKRRTLENFYDGELL